MMGPFPVSFKQGQSTDPEDYPGRQWHQYDDLLPVEGGSSTIYLKMEDDKRDYGLLDASGTVLLSGLYHFNFSEGLAVVSRRDGTQRNAVVDTLGNIVVPFDRYKEISPFRNGIAVVEMHDKASGCINTKGDLLVRYKGRDWSYHSKELFVEGLQVVHVRDTSQTRRSRLRNAFADLNGALIGDTSWASLTSLAHGRAFARVGWDYILVDGKAQQISETRYRKVVTEGAGPTERPFTDGKALVVDAQGPLMIDTMGKPLVRLKDQSGFDELMRRGDLLIVARSLPRGKHWEYDDEDEDEDDDEYDEEDYDDEVYRFRLWDLRTGRRIAKEYDHLSFLDDVPGVLFFKEEGRMGYLDHSGRVIWQQSKKGSSQFHPLNADHMVRGYFYAASEGPGALDRYGGWGGSSNHSMPAGSNTGGGLSIEVDTTKRAVWQEQYEGYPVVVRNNGPDTLFFPAQDSRLYMKTQARVAAADWRDIEYLPRSWCGNSYHTLFLAPGEQWQFTVPRYTGATSADLRIELKYSTAPGKADELFMYSHTFNGSVNPAQFWRRQDYSPRGLMDPYFE